MNPLTQAQLINLFLEVLYYQRRHSEASANLHAFLKQNNIGDAQLQAIVLDPPRLPEKGKASEMNSPNPAPDLPSRGEKARK